MPIKDLTSLKKDECWSCINNAYFSIRICSSFQVQKIARILNLEFYDIVHDEPLLFLAISFCNKILPTWLILILCKFLSLNEINNLIQFLQFSKIILDYYVGTFENTKVSKLETFKSYISEFTIAEKQVT